VGSADPTYHKYVQRLILPANPLVAELLQEYGISKASITSLEYLPA
jgi:hypothetical protein